MSAQTGNVDMVSAVRSAMAPAPGVAGTPLPTPGVGPALVQVRLQAQPEALKPGKGKALEAPRHQNGGASAIANMSLQTAYGGVELSAGTLSGSGATMSLEDAARTTALAHGARESNRLLGRGQGIMAYTHANGGVVSLGVDRWAHIERFHISTPPHARTR